MKQERFYDYWTIRVKRLEKLKKAVSRFFSVHAGLREKSEYPEDWLLGE